MARFRRSSLLLLIGVSVAACKKDQDDTAPRVRIVAPSTGTTISIPDTFTVLTEVSDENIVEALTVDLQDAAGHTLASSGRITVNSASTTVAAELRLTDERVPTGTYTLVARATDGENDGRGFQGVHVQSTPLRLRALFVAPAFSTDPVGIIRIDSLGTESNLLTIQDFNGLAVDNYWQHVVVAGSRFAALHVLPTSSTANTWQFAPPTNDVPEQFTAVVVDPTDRLLYFATRDGFIRGFTGEGSQRFTAQCVEGHRCERIVMLGNERATLQRAIVGGGTRIITYTPAGTIAAQLPTQHDAIELFAAGDNSLVQFANAGGDGLVQDLHITAGGSPILRTFAGEAIRAVVQLDAHTYVIALGNRAVRFDHDTNDIVQLFTGITVDAMCTDPANGVLYIAAGNLLHTIDQNDGTVVDSRAMSFAIEHLAPLFNR